MDLDGLAFFCCTGGLFLGGDFDLEREGLRLIGAAAAGAGRLLFLGGEWDTDLEGLLLWGCGLLLVLGGVAELEALLFLSG